MKIEKEDLINCRFTKNFLKDRLDELAERRELLNKLIATYGDTPKASSEIQDRVAEGLATLMDKTKEYEDQLIAEQQKIDEIARIIESMNNKLYGNILYAKYIRGKNLVKLQK